MIYIDRESLDEHGAPIRPDEEWFTAAEDATEIAFAERGEHDFDEALYKTTLVRAALERLFHDKCAYCEWCMTGGSDWDVEHFRPKGRVAERSDHPGYYWLAYEWMNLYPSCTYCNRRRADKPRWGDLSVGTTAGKHDQFPLHDEATRVMSHEGNDGLLDEHTLLIDPCCDDPDYYLGFDPTGQIFSLSGNPYGEATINVFSLTRRRLRDLRCHKVRRAVALVKLIKKCEEEDNDDAASELRNLFDSEKDDTAEFAAVARYVEKSPEAFGI